MIDAEKQTAVTHVPLARSFVRRESQDLQIVLVGVAEVERLDAACVAIPVRQPLRAGGGVLDFESAQARIGACHVAHDDGNVLERPIVRLQTGRNRSAARSEELHELEVLVAEPQPYYSHAQSEYPEQPLV